MAAYDLKDLVEKLKGQNLPLALDFAEKEAGLFYVAMKQWIQESAVASDNKVDDVIAPFLNYLDAFVLPQIDKINGKVG